MSFITTENNYKTPQPKKYATVDNHHIMSSAKQPRFNQSRLYHLVDTPIAQVVEEIKPIIGVQYIEPEDYPSKPLKKSSSLKISDTNTSSRHGRHPLKERSLFSVPNVGIGLMAISPIYISNNPTAAAVLFGSGLMTYAVSNSLEKGR